MILPFIKLLWSSLHYIILLCIIAVSCRSWWTACLSMSLTLCQWSRFLSIQQCSFCLVDSGRYHTSRNVRFLVASIGLSAAWLFSVRTREIYGKILLSVLWVLFKIQCSFKSCYLLYRYLLAAVVTTISQTDYRYNRGVGVVALQNGPVTSIRFWWAIFCHPSKHCGLNQIWAWPQTGA